MSKDSPVCHITDPEAARALRHYSDFLALFVQPTSPTDAARTLGMAANLAHHHTQKLLALGLLHEQKREGGKVYYQLAAQEFRVPRTLLPHDESAREDLERLSNSFLQAYEHSWFATQHSEEDSFVFVQQGPRPRLAPPPPPADIAFPAHLEEVSLCLSPERYSQLARQVSALIRQAASEGHSEGGQPCTLAVLAFQTDSPHPNQLSHHLNSFIGDE